MSRNKYNIRPMEERDLDMVLEWRNSERVRACMYTDHIITRQEHQAWFERIQRMEFPTTLIFEYCGAPAGLKSFSQIDRHNNRCHWGFYLGETELPRGCATAMGFLALEYIFEEHNFRKLCAEAFAFNAASLGYHRRLGFSQEGCFVRHVLKNSCYEDVISLAVFRDDWLAIKPALAIKLFGGEE